MHGRGLKKLIAAGTLKPAIARRYPLSDVVEALRHVDEGRAEGKVVLTPLAAGCRTTLDPPLAKG